MIEKKIIGPPDTKKNASLICWGQYESIDTTFIKESEIFFFFCDFKAMFLSSTEGRTRLWDGYSTGYTAEYSAEYISLVFVRPFFLYIRYEKFRVLLQITSNDQSYYD